MNRKEMLKWYPLCIKYNVPIDKDGLVVFDATSNEAWLLALPDDWSQRFGEVMGPVTCSDRGFYACDIEDTLWALQNNQPHRRSNG